MERKRGQKQRSYRTIPTWMSAGFGDSVYELFKLLSGFEGWQPKFSADRCLCAAQRQQNGSASPPFIRPSRLGPVFVYWIGNFRYFPVFDLRAQIFALTRSERHRKCPLFTPLLPLQTWKLPLWVSNYSAPGSMTTGFNYFKQDGIFLGCSFVTSELCHWVHSEMNVKLPRNRLWRPIGLWDVVDLTLSRQSAHRWR
jgi:hypothetical protein